MAMVEEKKKDLKLMQKCLLYNGTVIEQNKTLIGCCVDIYSHLSKVCALFMINVG